MRLKFLLPVFCLSVLCGFAQSNGTGAGSRPFVLDVTVTDKAGHPDTGLQQQDFTVLEDKQRQNIESFQAVQVKPGMQDAPVQAILVLDEVNTSFNWTANARQQAQNFLEHNSERLPLPMSMVFFSDQGTQIETQPTLNANVLLTGLQKHETALRTMNRSQGFYGATDRFDLSVRTLNQLAAYEAAKPGRKIVIWISPGWPLLSGPNVILTSKQQQQLFQTIVGTTDQLRKARITLYSVDPLGTTDAGSFRTFYWEQFTKGVKSPNQVQIGNLALQVFAFQSGGRVFTSSNDVAGEIQTCINDSRGYYELTIAGRPSDGPNDYHSIEVKLDRPGETARTETGYYAQPGK